MSYCSRCSSKKAKFRDRVTGALYCSIDDCMLISGHNKSGMSDADLYDILSTEPVADQGHEPPLDLYPDHGPMVHGKVTVDTGYNGVLENNIVSRGKYQYAYTTCGKSGPLWVVFLHGVPTNRRQWWPIQKRVARFLPTLSFDMLGMGESDHPRYYGESIATINDILTGKQSWDPTKGAFQDAWKWQNDARHYDQIFDQIIPPNISFIFVADDWGGGQLAHYAAQKTNDDRLKGIVFLDPIAFDGYPVSEIQAIGRSSLIASDEQFQMLMGAFDQTLVQIYKTMVNNPDRVYNQYSLRDIKYPYAEERYVETAPNTKSTSLTLTLKFHAIRVLAERASVLSSALLLPFHPSKNREGVRYSNITAPALILWGAQDNMMPETQRYRFELVLQNSSDVEHRRVHDAGHFAGTDQPDQVAEDILNWIKRTQGLDVMPTFLGFTGIFKGDEQHIIDKLK